MLTRLLRKNATSPNAITENIIWYPLAIMLLSNIMKHKSCCRANQTLLILVKYPVETSMVFFLTSLFW